MPQVWQTKLSDDNDTLVEVPAVTPPGPTLPGEGEPGGDCGQEVPYHCNHCNTSFKVTSSCMMRTCPNCWRKWAWKEARRAGLRMWSGCQLRVGSKYGYRILHIVVSLPNGTLQRQRKAVMKICKEHGISGGLSIFHPFRQPGEEWIDDGYDHFHVIGLARGDVTPGGNDGEVIFKVIKDARRKDYRGFQRCLEIKSTIFYLLTHCGIIKGRSSVTWFGELSYNQLSNKALLEARPDMADTFNNGPKRVCPCCGSDDIESDYITDWTDTQNPYFIDNRLKAG